MACFTAYETSALDHPSAVYAALEAHGAKGDLWASQQVELLERQLLIQQWRLHRNLDGNAARVRRLVNELDAFAEARADYAIDQLLVWLEGNQSKNKIV